MPQSTNAPEGPTPSQAGAQETQQTTVFTAMIDGTPTTVSFVPGAMSVAAPGALSSISDLALPEPPPAPSLSTATLNGVLATFLALPDLPPNTEILSSSPASAVPAQTGAAQPQPTFAVLAGTTISFLASPPVSTGSDGASAQAQEGQQPTPITALVSGSIVTSWAVPLPSAASGPNSPSEDETQSDQQPESNVGPGGNSQTQLLPQAQLITTTISGTAVTAWSIPPNGTPGVNTQTQSSQRPEPTNLAVFGGTTASFLTASPTTLSAGGQAQGPQPIAITALVSGSFAASWAVPLASATDSDSPASSQTRLLPQAELITTTISGTAVIAWSIPPNESPGGDAQTQAAAALISAIEGVASQASTAVSGSNAITNLRDNPSSSGTGASSSNAITTLRDDPSSSGTSDQSGFSVTTAIGSQGSSVSDSTMTQVGSSAQISPAVASSSTSGAGAGWVNVPWGTVLAGCWFALVVV